MNAKKIYTLCFMTYMVFLFYAFYDNFTRGYTHSFLMTFASLILVFIVPALFKLCKWKPVYEIYTFVVIFVAMASLLGSSYRFYDHVPYWDKYTHMFSGILGALFAYVLYCSLKHVKVVDKKEVPIMLIFVNALNITIATLWEQYEYLTLIIADYDAIRHYSTGVHDSMTDISVCIIGGLIFTGFLVARYRSGKPNFFTNIYEKFYELNIEKNR